MITSLLLSTAFVLVLLAMPVAGIPFRHYYYGGDTSCDDNRSEAKYAASSVEIPASRCIGLRSPRAGAAPAKWYQIYCPNTSIALASEFSDSSCSGTPLETGVVFELDKCLQVSEFDGDSQWFRCSASSVSAGAAATVLLVALIALCLSA